MTIAGLDPHMAQILELGAEANLPPFESMSAVAARAAAEERFAFWNEQRPAVQSVNDIHIPGPGGAMQMRIYVPNGAAERGPGALFLHGGCWVYGSVDTHDDFCRRLANASGFRFASLNYRTAPEYPFPAPLEDCVAGANWLHENGASIGIDPDRIAISGDSAGANLALASCVAVRDRKQRMPRAAALLYGVYSSDDGAPSYREYGGGHYIISRSLLNWGWDQYAPNLADRATPLAAPLNADLTGMPPLYVSAAQLDPLRDDSERLAARLAAFGVDFDYRLLRGFCHACTMMSRMLPTADAQIAEIGDFLRRRLK
jgi:acetyl esterase